MVSRLYVLIALIYAVFASSRLSKVPSPGPTPDSTPSPTRSPTYWPTPSPTLKSGEANIIDDDGTCLVFCIYKHPYAYKQNRYPVYKSQIYLDDNELELRGYTLKEGFVTCSSNDECKPPLICQENKSGIGICSPTFADRLVSI